MSILIYLMYISLKKLLHWYLNLLSKIEKSRRGGKSRPIRVGFNGNNCLS